MTSKPLPAPRVAGGKWCMFLDVDGTLLEIAATPDSVSVDDSLRDLLLRVATSLDGAVALISGRTLSALDELFALGSWPAAGLHGAERRDSTGRVHVRGPSGRALEPVRAALSRLVADTPGALLEDKTRALAVHFRGAPEAEQKVRSAMKVWAARLAHDYQLLEGKCVMEIKPAAANKADAIDAFLREPPFAGRTPIFIGDDVTDLDGFACVERAGGLPVAVGELPARFRLDSPREVREFLARIAGESRSAS